MPEPAESTRKRRIKNPESFREKAQKATAAQAKQGPLSRVWGVVKRGLGRVFSPIGRGLRTLFRYQPFKFIAKIARWIGLVLLPPYVRNSWRELRLVTWPNWKQSRQLTGAVLIFAVVFGAAIALVDYGLDKLFRHLLVK